MKIAILGFGSRGRTYANVLKNNIQGHELVSVCDTAIDKRISAEVDYQVDPKNIFSDANEFFEKGKIADCLIISTMDQDHYEQTMKALQLGYDILLEKPISPFETELLEMVEEAKKRNRKVAVCHVLRYAPFYVTIKEILTQGTIGNVVTMSQVENVGYWHQAHSFVRGNWRKKSISSPMILQKCCHDMDIMNWLIDKKCLKVSSFGSLSYFRSVNAPEGSADRCLDCKVKCIYNAVSFYENNEAWFDMISEGKTNVKEVLKTSPYGRCVYRCDNDVVDHQVTNLLYEDGVTAQHTMTAFSNDCHRNLKIHGTKGEIEGDMEQGKIYTTIFGGQKEEIDINKLHSNLTGHGGGDIRLLEDFLNWIENKPYSKSITTIDVSLQSHLMCFLAETSRLNDGETLFMDYS
jgi:predicted dehydrogenase